MSFIYKNKAFFLSSVSFNVDYKISYGCNVHKKSDKIL